jgi:HK97 family phage major capsid protein
MDEVELRRKRANAHEGQRIIIARAKAEGRDVLSDSETDVFKQLTATVDDCDHQLGELDRRAESRSAADRIFNAAQSANPSSLENKSMYRNSASPVYNETTAAQGRSFWADLVRMKSNDDADGSARRRLAEHAEAETRLGLTTTGDGSTLIPPAYLEDLWVPAAVAGKPFVVTLPQHPVPKAHTINVPKIITPPTVGVQATELSTVSNTDLTDTFVSTTLATVVGQQLISRQILDQSPIDIDSVVFQSLSQVWAQQQDALALHGTGSSGQFVGLDNIAGINTASFAGNSIANIYAAITNAISTIWSTRYASPTHILAHPATICEWLGKLDTTNRPLFIPKVQGPMNAAAILDNLNGQGPVGELLGLELVADPNITLSGGTSPVYVYRADDLMFFDSGPRAQVHYDYAASTLGVLLSLWSYSGLISRFPSSIVRISGFAYGS